MHVRTRYIENGEIKNNKQTTITTVGEWRGRHWLGMNNGMA